MAPDGEPHHLRFGSDFDLDRMRGFSDCVYAVAITLVVSTFRLPTDINLDNVQLVDWLGERWPHYLSYLAGFVVVGYYWLSHHRLFELIIRVNYRLIWLNFGLLFFVVLMPFPTEILGSYHDLQGSYRFFNALATLLGLMNFACWWYATRGHRLVSPTLDPKALRIYRLRALWLPLVFAFAFVVSALQPAAPLWQRQLVAMACWSLLFLGRPLIRWIFGPVPPVESTEEDAELGDEAAMDLAIARRERPGSARESVPRQLLESIFRSSTSLGRLISFSDNVYAFAITLLGTHFRSPSETKMGGRSTDLLTQYLRDLWSPDFVSFALSFFVIAVFWTIHHRYSILIERQDGRLRVLNLMHLMSIAAIPFAVDVLSTFADDEAPFVVFAAVLTVASTTLSLMFTYAFTGHRLIDPAVPPEDIRIRLFLCWLTPACCLLSIPMTLIYWQVAWVLWIIPLIAVTYVKHEKVVEQRQTALAPNP